MTQRKSDVVSVTITPIWVSSLMDTLARAPRSAPRLLVSLNSSSARSMTRIHLKSG